MFRNVIVRMKKKPAQPVELTHEITPQEQYNDQTCYYEMKKILKKAERAGIMSERRKTKMADLIRRKGNFPQKYRRKLWLLASGSERMKKCTILVFELCSLNSNFHCFRI